jgi:hypothetical protein
LVFGEAYGCLFIGLRVPYLQWRRIAI